MTEIPAVGDLAERAFRRHYRHVYRYVRRRAASAEEAEDLTQAFFADAVAAADRLRPGSPPLLAWLYTVAKRRLADEARRLERGPVQVVPLDGASRQRPRPGTAKRSRGRFAAAWNECRTTRGGSSCGGCSKGDRSPRSPDVSERARRRAGCGSSADCAALWEAFERERATP